MGKISLTKEINDKKNKGVKIVLVNEFVGPWWSMCFGSKAKALL
jgi:hypothetical protein